MVIDEEYTRGTQSQEDTAQSMQLLSVSVNSYNRRWIGLTSFLLMLHGVSHEHRTSSMAQEWMRAVGFQLSWLAELIV